MRFEKLNDCYRDTETGLEWSLENYGPMSWENAIEFCKELNGWRLPTIRELLTLVDYGEYEPATRLPGMASARYWSSTTSSYGNAVNVWFINFNDGSDSRYYKSYCYCVRAVRGALRYQV